MTARPTTRENLAAAALSPRDELLARLVAEDEKTNAEIARAGKISRQRLDQLIASPAFAARVAEHRERFRDAMLTVGFADKRLRVGALNTVATALLEQLRAGKYETVVGRTEEGAPITGFAAAPLRELREYLTDIAEEMGDRGGTDGKPLTVNVGVAVALAPAEREERAAAILARLGPADA